MYGTIHGYGTVYVTVHDTVHIDGSMMWHWLITWHWLMRCHDPVGLKFLYTVDGDVAAYQWTKISHTVHASHRIIFNQTTLLFIRVKLCYCSSVWSNRGLLTDDVAQFWASKLFLIRWPWFTPCIYKKGASPPLIWYLWIYFWDPFSVIPSPSCIFFVF